jgi:hypothetical protein
VTTDGDNASLTFASSAASTLEIAPLDSLSLALSPTSALVLSAVTDDATRSLSGSVTAAGGAAPSYATFSLDQSGTGTISYGGAAAIPVTSWVLSG